MSLLKGTEVVVSGKTPRERKGGRLAAVAVLVFLILAGVAFYGRRVTTYRYSSGELSSTDGTGAQSGGGEGPFTLDARDARLRWYLNPGVDHVQMAVIPASAREKFAGWPESDVTAGDVGGIEFSSSDREGIWNLDTLPTGVYWVRYSWWTRGSDTGHWTFQIEQRVPWWKH